MKRQSRRQSRRKRLRIVTGVAWYRPEQWQRLREIADDRENLEATYEDWLILAEKQLAELRKQGLAIRKVDIDVEALLQWCRAEERPVDAAARADFAADELRRAHLEQWKIG